MADHPMRDTTDAVIDLGRVALAFGRVDRITFHEDGVTPESDTDHTVMLGLIACAFAERYLTYLDIGLIAQYALVHDLVEVYAGDTPTLHALSADAKQAKADREAAALERLSEQFAGRLTWVPLTIADYEARTCPEARYVKALDKLLPKITHILNGCSTVRSQGMTRHQLAARYDVQLAEIQEYAADFPQLLALRRELIGLVMVQMLKGGGRAAEQSETHRVSPAPTGDAGSRERLDPLAATTPTTCDRCGYGETNVHDLTNAERWLAETILSELYGAWGDKQRASYPPDPVGVMLRNDPHYMMCQSAIRQARRLLLAAPVLAAGSLCSQCGERCADMVKIGTPDGWCSVCLDEAADVALRDRVEALAALYDQPNWRGWGIPQAIRRLLDPEDES